MELNGKIAVVTGGDKPSGQAIAVALANAGCKLVVTGNTQEPLDELKAKLDNDGKEIVVVVTDLTQEKEFDRLFNGTITTYGGLDILVNNYSTYQSTDLISDSSSDMILQFERMLYPIFYATKWATEVMMETGRGAIVNIGSAIAFFDFDSDAAYSAIQYALRGFSINGTGELSEHNISMSLISTGIVEGEPEPEADEYKKLDRVKPVDVGDAVVNALQTGKQEITVPKGLRRSSAFKSLFK